MNKSSWGALNNEEKFFTQFTCKNHFLLLVYTPRTQRLESANLNTKTCTSVLAQHSKLFGPMSGLMQQKLLTRKDMYGLPKWFRTTSVYIFSIQGEFTLDVKSVLSEKLGDILGGTQN